MTKKEYERDLNEIGPPDHDHPKNGGRVPWSMVDKYGTWLRKHDPIMFEVGLNERERS